MPCNSMERALTQLTSMGGYLAGVIVSAPQDFGYLVAGGIPVQLWGWGGLSSLLALLTLIVCHSLLQAPLALLPRPVSCT